MQTLETVCMKCQSLFSPNISYKVATPDNIILPRSIELWSQETDVC